jgi:hypothetical protein
MGSFGDFFDKGVIWLQQALRGYRANAFNKRHSVLAAGEILLSANQSTWF